VHADEADLNAFDLAGEGIALVESDRRVRGNMVAIAKWAQGAATEPSATATSIPLPSRLLSGVHASYTPEVNALLPGAPDPVPALYRFLDADLIDRRRETMATVTVRDTQHSMTDAGEIRAFLQPFGIWYRRFEGSDQLSDTAEDQEILAAYDEPLLRQVASRLVRPRSHWPTASTST